MTENTRKSYLAMDVGTTLDKNGNVIPYAFFVEGIVTSVGTFREASDGKPAVQNMSILVGRNPWALLGKDVEAEQANNPDINDDKRFVSVGVFGNAAARIKDIKKGQKVVLCGRPAKNNYKKKTGEDATYPSTWTRSTSARTRTAMRRLPAPGSTLSSTAMSGRARRRLRMWVCWPALSPSLSRFALPSPGRPLRPRR